MKVAIIMGSDSDWPIVKPAADMLKEFGIEPVVEVASAHRTPGRVKEFVESADEKGIALFIAAAGAAAHLGGVIASYTTKPVIGIPINASPMNGLDALLATVQMPSGIPVATMAINGAKNAAIYAFSSIMRISNNNCNEEEKSYWDKYGKKLFDYSSFQHNFYCT